MQGFEGIETPQFKPDPLETILTFDSMVPLVREVFGANEFTLQDIKTVISARLRNKDNYVRAIPSSLVQGALGELKDAKFITSTGNGKYRIAGAA